MIRTAIVCPDSDLRQGIEKILAEIRSLFVTRRLSHYPNEADLTRFIQASGSELVFLSMEAPERALDLAILTASIADNIQIVALTRQRNEELLLSLMKAGVRHVLTAPFDAASVTRAVHEAAERIDERRSSPGGGRLYSFLPAKPGSGASTLALNATLALVRERQGPALLMDFDFNLGVIGFLLGLPAGQAAFDAASDALDPDEKHWSRRVAAVEGIDVLPSGGLNPGMRIEMAHLRHLLDFARRAYSSVCVDMSGNLETFSVEILRESQRIVLVTSLDPVAAHLAVKKLRLLGRLDLAERVLVVATRTTEWDWLPVSDLEKQLDRDVDLVAAYDRAAVRAAVEARAPVDPRSSTGKRCTEIAGLLAKPHPPGRLSTLKRAFLEHFSLSPAR
jgi:pilus assembly protein CpaE